MITKQVVVSLLKITEQLFVSWYWW